MYPGTSYQNSKLLTSKYLILSLSNKKNSGKKPIACKILLALVKFTYVQHCFYCSDKNILRLTLSLYCTVYRLSTFHFKSVHGTVQKQKVYKVELAMYCTNKILCTVQSVIGIPCRYEKFVISCFVKIIFYFHKFMIYRYSFFVFFRSSSSNMSPKQFETPAIIRKEVRACIAVRMLAIIFKGQKSTIRTIYKLLDEYYHGTSLVKSHMDCLLTGEGGLYKSMLVASKQASSSSSTVVTDSIVSFSTTTMVLDMDRFMLEKEYNIGKHINNERILLLLLLLDDVCCY